MDNLITRVALRLASRRAIEYCNPTEDDLEDAGAVVALVLDEAASVAGKTSVPLADTQNLGDKT